MHLSLHLPSAPDAPALARRRVRELLHRTGHGEDVRDTVELLTSELVTNAVRHGAGDRTAVSVDGMTLVHDLATRWGIEFRRGEGKTVWFELATQASGSVRHAARAAVDAARGGRRHRGLPRGRAAGAHHGTGVRPRADRVGSRALEGSTAGRRPGAGDG